MKFLLRFTVILGVPKTAFARAGFSEGELSFIEEWLFVIVTFSPVAIISALLIGLVSAICFGQLEGDQVRFSKSSALLSVFLSLAIYCLGAAILVVF